MLFQKLFQKYSNNSFLNRFFINKNNTSSNLNPNSKNDDDELSFEEQITYFQENQLQNQHLLVHEILNFIISSSNKPFQSIKTSLSDSFYQDLELFENYEHSSSINPTLFSKLDNTHTSFGKYLLEWTLKNPTHDLNTLENRIKSIRNISNTAVYYSIKNILRNISQNEKDILWFYQELDDYRKNIYQSIYFQYPYINFINEYLNKNSAVLLTIQIYKILLSPLITILTPIMSIIIPIVIWKVSGSKIPFGVLWKLIYKILFQSIWSSESMSAIFITIASMGVWLFFYIQSLYSIITIAKQTERIIQIIHSKMNIVREWIDNIAELHTICETNQIIYRWIPSTYNFEEMGKIIKDMKKIVEHPVFVSKPSILSNKGVILSQYYLFLKNKEKFNYLLHYLGEIDLLQSISTLFIKYQYQFPNFYHSSNTVSKKSNKTKLQITGLWHPYLTDSNVVKNNMNMKSSPLWILTGPNAAGKSTFIKSVMLNILLSQTIVLSSCQSIYLTPFHYLFTYLHIPDIKGKHSLFQAEMERNKIFLQHLERCDKSQNTFMIVDELFSSTNYDEGVSAAYSILKKITEYKNQKTIVTTHFTELTKLEKDIKKRVKNYYFTVDMKEGENGKKRVKYNYELKRGINKKKIALQLLQENSFSEDIMKDAINFFEKLEKK